MHFTAEALIHLRTVSVTVSFAAMSTADDRRVGFSSLEAHRGLRMDLRLWALGRTLTRNLGTSLR